MRRSAYRGCLLGLAVGDAMGYTVDSKSWAEIQEDYGPNGLLGMAVGDAMGYTVDSRSWQEIQEDYGPNGLLGYDLVNG